MILDLGEIREVDVMGSISALGGFIFVIGVFGFGFPMLVSGAGAVAIPAFIFGGIGGLISLIGLLFERD